MTITHADPRAIARANLSFVESWRAWARGTAGGRIAERDGVVCIATGIVIPYFSTAVFTRMPDDPAGAIAFVRDFFLPHGLRPTVYAFGEVAEEIGPLLEADGFVFQEHETVMLLDPGELRAPPAVPGLAIEVVRDAAALQVFNRTAAVAFEMPAELLAPFDDPRQLEQPGLVNYLGLLDGQPVATSQLVVSHRAATVNTVGTLPELRGRGIGAALTWRAARDGLADGALLATLHASGMGFGVYQRLGFRHVADYHVWGLPG